MRALFALVSCDVEATARPPTPHRNPALRRPTPPDAIPAGLTERNIRGLYSRERVNGTELKFRNRQPRNGRAGRRALGALSGTLSDALRQVSPRHGDTPPRRRSSPPLHVPSNPLPIHPSPPHAPQPPNTLHPRRGPNGPEIDAAEAGRVAERVRQRPRPGGPDAVAAAPPPPPRRLGP